MVATHDIGFLLYPNVTQLDATGPAQMLCRVPGARIHTIWKTLDPIPTDSGFALVPTDTFASCPQLDTICVPGGAGQIALMTDEETLSFLRLQARGARYITAVCTGSLVLGAAGLLTGYRATSHWAWRSQLSAFGAVPVADRVVRDRNRITGGGVTAGIDFGLALVAVLAGEETAKLIQLGMEYDPAPPFDCGSPQKAGPDRVATLMTQYEPLRKAREAAMASARTRRE